MKVFVEPDWVKQRGKTSQQIMIAFVFDMYILKKISFNAIYRYVVFLSDHENSMQYFEVFRHISVKDFKFIEAIILMCLLINCARKISEILTLKLTIDLVVV